VINYDVYRYGYEDYNAVAGVVLATTKQDFETTLQRMTSDESYRAEVTRLQRGDASRWGFLDGRCGDRLLALFDRLAPDGKAPPIPTHWQKNRERHLENT
jgi:hypothetical protein